MILKAKEYRINCTIKIDLVFTRIYCRCSVLKDLKTRLLRKSCQRSINDFPKTCKSSRLESIFGELNISQNWKPYSFSYDVYKFISFKTAFRRFPVAKGVIHFTADHFFFVLFFVFVFPDKKYTVLKLKAQTHKMQD